MNTEKRRGPTAMPVRINGAMYPSVKAAADAMGLSIQTIYGAIARGAENTVGTGRETVCKPTTIDGVTYPSRSAAARALGLKPSAVINRIRRRRGA